MEELAVEAHVHADIDVHPVPVVTHVILGKTMSLDQLSLGNSTREEQKRMSGVSI